MTDTAPSPTPLVDDAVDLALRLRTCVRCAAEFDPTADPFNPCPDVPIGPDVPHQAAEDERRLPCTSEVSVELLDELGPQHPVGIVEIAKALGVKRQTVDVWKWRDWFPAPSPTTLGSRPFWFWGDVRAWAIKTGRLVEQPAPPDPDDPDAAVRTTVIGRPIHPRTPAKGDDAETAAAAEVG